MTVLLAVGVMVLCAAFLGLRVLFGKDEEVRRPGCSNANAFMDDQEACPICGVAGRVVRERAGRRPADRRADSRRGGLTTPHLLNLGW